MYNFENMQQIVSRFHLKAMKWSFYQTPSQKFIRKYLQFYYLYINSSFN